MNYVIKLFGWWICFYSGGTSKKRRLWFWKFNGAYNVNRGITLRLRGEFCLGIQWRRLRHDWEFEIYY